MPGTNRVQSKVQLELREIDGIDGFPGVARAERLHFVLSVALGFGKEDTGSVRPLPVDILY